MIDARRSRPLCAVLLLTLATPAAASTPITPEETVRRYLQAMKDGKFADAYPLVSKAMRQGKDQEVWVKEQQVGMAWAEVKIFSFDVRPGKVEGDKAFVPNVLSSQDRFVNQLGLTEHELYTLVREDGTWRVDQQVIVEPADVPRWFPRSGAGKEPAAAPAHAP
jgi:methanogenic corrinoid protein MtbC1